MNSPTPAPATRLDGFETALLTELRDVVARASSSAGTMPDPNPGRDRKHRVHPSRRRWSAAIVAIIAAAVIATLAINGLKPTPAFAVSGGSNTKIKIHVMRLEGAAALERALDKRGVRADITYLPAGHECAGHRYTQQDTPGLMLSVGAKDFTVTIPAGAVGKHDTFVLAASVHPHGTGFQAWVDFGIATGPVKACRVIPAK